ncbi:GATA zinc finger domain containing 2Ab isoform X2 [Electrophorus electricus]|uniref:GATA zinc finger domain containing 2Ab isoform X2 n=1 Tax=Electrophorus electricus TaxID=8005 RepID=UPI0015D097BC|nr:GATA zinc finger domain containing 2Ab isoform X2 [Electrophorus electricus]
MGPCSSRVPPPFAQTKRMSEDVARQTRSQKRALEREVPALDGEPKRLKLDRGELVSGKVASILKTGEVKATIKVEVQAHDEPVDMSTSRSHGDIKKERPPTPDDVIVLSDNEPSSPCVNGMSQSFKKTDTEMLMRSSPEERQKIITQLREELRLQEAKLVLLKKLRQSQIQKESVVSKATNSLSNPPPLVRGSITSSKAPLQVSSGRSAGTVIPPPLVRGGAQVSKQASVVMPPLVRGSQQIATLRQQHSGSGPPPLLLGPRTSVPSVQVQGQRIIQQGLIRVANVPNSNMLVSIPQGSPTGLKGSSGSTQLGAGSNTSSGNASDSPASRQAAAKLALRKQLEKTLLEIPPPKPPAPELNFLPSAANNEFIYLVGLEMVVQTLLDLTKSKQQAAQQQGSPTPAPPTKEPFTCAQCQTDFTARWRQEKSGGSILCEQCMSSNQKKVLKAEHTSRLKAAFVKALQQEQEIEQRILQQAATAPSAKSSPSPTTSVPSPVGKAEHALVSAQYKAVRSALPQQQAGRVSHYHSSSIKQSPGQLARSVQAAVVSASSRALAHGFTTSSQLQSAVSAAALVSRPGKHAVRAGAKSGSSGSNPAPGAWRKQSSSAPGVTMAYVNPSLSVHKTTSPVDRQREYLLDMIPSRSLSQTTNTWK